MTEKHLPLKQQTMDGAELESNEPQSEEPSGRSLRDGLSAAPSPVDFRTLNSVDSDFEDHPGDGPPGAFVVWLAIAAFIVVIALAIRFW